jgi:creatinine amidohydrolase
MSRVDVQMELLLPSEIRAALDQRSIVYMPLGTYEWHGEHLPIGLDGLTAHGICLAAARRDGGLVLPPLYYGTGGGHADYPWTIMTSPADLGALITATLQRLGDFGVRAVVLMSGHFAGEQIALIEAIASDWNDAGRPMQVKALAVSMACLALAPDHAAIFETTLLSALWPDRVRVDLLPAVGDTAIDPDGNAMGPHRHDPAHPLYGIFGPDPRHYHPASAPGLLAAMVDWVVGEAGAMLPQAE